MHTRIFVTSLLLSCLTACGQDAPVKQQEKSFGGQLGDAYQGMLNDARQGVADVNQQMRNTDQAVRDRHN